MLRLSHTKDYWNRAGGQSACFKARRLGVSVSLLCISLSEAGTPRLRVADTEPSVFPWMHGCKISSCLRPDECYDTPDTPRHAHAL